MSVHSRHRQGREALRAVSLRKAPELYARVEAHGAGETGSATTGSEGRETVVMGTPRMTVYKAKDRPCSKCKGAPRKEGKSWCSPCITAADKLRNARRDKGAAA